MCLGVVGGVFVIVDEFRIRGFFDDCRIEGFINPLSGLGMVCSVLSRFRHSATNQ